MPTCLPKTLDSITDIFICVNNHICTLLCKIPASKITNLPTNLRTNINTCAYILHAITIFFYTMMFITNVEPLFFYLVFAVFIFLLLHEFGCVFATDWAPSVIQPMHHVCMTAVELFLCSMTIIRKKE